MCRSKPPREAWKTVNTRSLIGWLKEPGHSLPKSFRRMVVRDPAQQRLLTGDAMEAGKQRRAIGGEIELGGWPAARPGKLGVLARGCAGTWNASGRGALTLVLRRLKSLGVTHVQLPAYLCESLLLAVNAAALEHSFYPVDENLVSQPNPRRACGVGH